MRPILVGIGELLWDLLPSGRQLGGAPANFAYHAQALGGLGLVVSAVGSDSDGQQLLRQLAALGLSTKYIAVDENHPTGTVSVQVDANGKPSYTIHRNVAWDFIPQAPETLQLAGWADAICFGSLAQRSDASRSAIHAFLRESSFRALRVFDVNLRQLFYSRELIESSLRYADVLKMNDEELRTLADLFSLSGDEATILDHLAKSHDLKLIAITKGETGSLIYSEGECSAHPGFDAEVVDSVGAGDAFTAALVLGILCAHDLDAISDHANRVAAFVCSQPGATPEIPEELGLRDRLVRCRSPH